MSLLAELLTSEKFARFKLEEFNAWQNYRTSNPTILEFSFFENKFVTRSGIIKKLFKCKKSIVSTIVSQNKYEFVEFGAERIEDPTTSKRRQFLEVTNCPTGMLTSIWQFNPISVAVIGLNKSSVFCGWLGLNKPSYSVGYCYQIFKQLKFNHKIDQFSEKY